MRSVLAAILVLEAIVVGLAVLGAAGLSDGPRPVALAVAGGVALACLVSCALLRWRAGIVAGSVVQVATIALGFVVTLMFILGVIFATLWFGCLVLDRRLAARAADGSV